MRRTVRSATFISLVMASGCSIGPDYIAPTTSMPDTYVDADPGSYTVDTAKSDWWGRFDDLILAELIVEAIASNKSLEVALSRVNQARALRSEAIFELLPHGVVSSAYTNTKTPAVRFGDVSAGDIEYESYSAGIDAAWELDILGRSRRNLEARSAERDAALASLEDGVRILIAEVASNYIRLRGFQSELDVAERNVETQRQVLEVVAARSSAGEGTELDYVRAEALLSTTKATVPRFAADIKQSMNRLAVLLGKQPHEVRAKLESRSSVPTYKGTLNLGSPSELLRRRPDIREAERLLAASVADIGVSMGDLFPRVTLLGSLVIEAPTPDEWGKTGTRGYGMGPRIEWPILDLGRVLSRIDAADARAFGALKFYEAVVLLALEETSSSLSSLTASRDQLAEFQNAVKHNRRAFELSLAGYREGAVDFLTVLEAQRSMLFSEAAVVQAQTSYAGSIVSLYKSLGGGWEEFPIADRQENAAP